MKKPDGMQNIKQTIIYLRFLFPDMKVTPMQMTEIVSKNSCL